MSINYISLLKQKSILDYFAREGISLTKNGKNYSCCCPLHSEKTPSFSVSPDKNKWNCFGECKLNGDIIDFVCHYRHLDKKEAINYLCNMYGITKKKGSNNKNNDKETKVKSLIEICNIVATFYHEQIQKGIGKQGKKYFLERLNCSALINEFNIGYSPHDSECGTWQYLLNHLSSKGIDLTLAENIGLIRKSEKGNYYDSYRGRLIFPIYSVTGDCIGFNTRILPHYQKDSPKYLISNETEIFKKSQIVYGYHKSAKEIKNKNTAIHVEGVYDYLNFYRYGLKNTLPHLGAPNFIPNVDNHIIVMDPDKAGIKYSLDFANKIMKNGKNPRICLLKNKKDPSDLMKEEIRETLKENRDWLDIFLQIHYRYKDSIEHKMNVIDKIVKELNGIENERIILYGDKI